MHHSLIVHFEDDQPLQLENRYVLPSFARDYLKQDFTRRTPYEYLMSLGPLDEVEHLVQALMPDRPTRALARDPRRRTGIARPPANVVGRSGRLDRTAGAPRVAL